jgi:hypothetical protein
MDKPDLVTEQKVREALEDGKAVYYHVWSYSKNYMSCAEPGCCEDSLNGVDDAMNTIEQHCNGKWEEVAIDED